jgi:hypothetical protein
MQNAVVAYAGPRSSLGAQKTCRVGAEAAVYLLVTEGRPRGLESSSMNRTRNQERLGNVCPWCFVCSGEGEFCRAEGQPVLLPFTTD